MAKKASGKNETKGRGKGTKKSGRTGTAVAVRSSSRSSRSQEGMGDALIKLLQSPLVAELVAVAATAALASLAEHGFTRDEGTRGKRAGKAVKEAGKAAAAAVGRRVGTEIDEIRKAATGGAKA
ncbi:MAG TPA: hypothetical protein VK192_14390, partial [Sphingomicrobium sp.]|jgi:hypothetical protein|nr:hypothetical protein [Sphingomicrobium sp.]